MSQNMFTNDQVSSTRILYTPSDFARANLLHLQEVGSLRAVRPHVSSREGLASYLFFVVKAGRGQLVYEGVKYELKCGDCVFIDCRKPYSHSSSEDLWELAWCHFYGANMAALYGKYKERGGYAVFNADELGDETHSKKRFCAILEDLYEAAGSLSYVRDMQINMKLTELVTILMEESWHDAERGSSCGRGLAHGEMGAAGSSITQAKTYIDGHYTENMSLESIANHFYLNKSYLARAFKEQFGVSVVTYIRQVRISRAKELLRFTDDTVEAVGTACGIDDANYFTRVFKSVEGVTPMQFRKAWRG